MVPSFSRVGWIWGSCTDGAQVVLSGVDMGVLQCVLQGGGDVGVVH